MSFHPQRPQTPNFETQTPQISASDHDPVIVSLLLKADESAFGDLNADSAINFKDYIIIIRAYGSSKGTRRFYPSN